jgi:hypothetical protein
MIEFVKTIPPLILVGSGFLISLAVFAWIRMLTEAGRLSNELGALHAAWSGVEPLARDERRAGLEPRKLAEIYGKCKSLKGLSRTLWHTVEENLEKYTSAEEKEGWFLTRQGFVE